jgi:hypothetical protein
VLEDKKKMGIWAAIIALVSGGGGYATMDAALELGDQRWVTISSQNLELRFDTEDELAQIQRRIENGTDTEYDRIRRAVLQERLKRLLLEEAQ